MALPPAVQHISNHILGQLSKSTVRPLLVALQGPQGSGKSFLTDLVRTHLSGPPHTLNVVVLSIDDLYLTHDGLVSLSQRFPNNPLWRGRGQPGTHDVELGLKILMSLKEECEGLELPRFDKSLFNGEGDRLPLDGTGTIVHPPVDVFIMEGWFIGFHPVNSQELETKWEGIWAEERRLLDLDETVVGSKEDIIAVNEALKGYVDMWAFFDTFIKLEAASSPGSSISSLSMIYKWRLEQEQYMKARNGGKGMSDAAVKLFVDRYIPGYVFFADGIFKGYIVPSDGKTMSRTAAYPQWLGRSLRVYIDERRNVVGVENF
ncbi:P-loop containing nucleoside triphosphate hydrolase protein [Lentinula aff. detonsa]|uniref:P-loop containing nucleoside triphosphate hydrolase protein n=1 Tax=Lentinula aff. detonsa TaxID=2804958 RepID=A0AA38KRS8_9AGAR|nr:P-loop containing nucleoside triphosphate hydrolase protein [Lentinula aff. detonsa]